MPDSPTAPVVPGASPEEQSARIDALLADLSLEEKVWMLSGHGFFEQIKEDGGRYCARLYHIGAGNERLAIPPLLFMDGPRGVDMGSSTCFPVSMARGASFDIELEGRIGDAIGREIRAQGGNLFGGVCINLLRHPAWGRAQETYGEDPFHLGEMGAALTRGVQHHNVVATPKHFACNSMENARFKVDVKIDEASLREVYLPHFKKCIDAGAGAVMSAYNQVNGAYSGHNGPLLTQILKGDWEFDGFVYSDFVLGCRGADASAAGLDVEAPDTVHFGAKLLAAVEQGEVSPERIDDAVRRVLRILFRTLASPDPESYSLAQVACPDHVALAREASEKSIVLLRNENILPLDETALRRVVVLGRLADFENLGDHGSSRVFPPHVVTPLDGLRAALPVDCALVHDEGDDRDRIAALASGADAVIVVAGYTYEDEGEYIPSELEATGRNLGGDRVDLGIGTSQESMILAAAKANPKTIVALMSGSAVIVEAWKDQVAAILMLWYPGMQGGHALADVLLGRANPSGRLPFSVPSKESDLPFFDRDAVEITYDGLHGYTRFEDAGAKPAYAFGFGLGYSAFGMGAPNVTVEEGEGRLVVNVAVRNTGERSGVTVVQVYAGAAERDPEPRVRRLCGFARVEVEAGATADVRIVVPLREFARFDAEKRRWHLADGSRSIWVGSSSASDDLEGCEFSLGERNWTLADRPD